MAQRVHDRAVTKDAVYQAVHDLVDTAAHIVAEDLSGLRGRSKFGRTANRVYGAWQRSFLADALASVPSRRGSAVTLINPAYARNILARATDPHISRYTPKHEVKRILIDRAGTVENCPTTTQVTTWKGGVNCERNNPLPARSTKTKK
jgi:hypothetical protein